LGDQNGNTINTTYLTQSSASATYIPLSQKAQANGVATLGADGKVIPSQIPGIVSSVEEYDTLEDFPEVGVLTTVYLALDTGLTYLWSGSGYVALSSSLALGETSTTAYRGDRGKIAYDYSQVGHLPLAGGTVTGNLVVGGDLTISGTTTTIDTETIGIKDNIILINSNQTGVPSTALKGGLEIERGDLTNFQFVFDENDDRFKVGQIGSLQTVATRTDDGTIANRGITFFNTSTNRLENNANIVIDSSNNVGIGTNSPTAKLHLVGTGNSNSNAIIHARDNVATGSNTSYGAMVFTSSPGTDFFIGKKSVNSLSYFVLGNANTSADFLSIDGSGNVGIGTPSPAVRLDTVISSNGEVAKFSTTSTSAPFSYITVRSGTIGSLLGTDTTGGYIGTFSNHAFQIKSNDIERMRITSTGNVGIGTTSPSSSLQINDNLGFKLFIARFTGNSSDDPQLQLNIAKATRPSYSFDGDNDTGIYSPSANVIGISTNAVERIRIDSSGNVGIGTTSPTLQSGSGVVIYNATTPRLEFRNSTTGTANTDGAGIAVDTSILYIYNKENGATVFDTNNTERMRISSGGNVGIGTPSPTGRLDVFGISGITPLYIQTRNNTNNSSQTLIEAITDNATYPARINIVRGADSSQTSFAFNTSNGPSAINVERVRIDSAGNVGIGTPSPYTGLQVSNDGFFGWAGSFSNSAKTRGVLLGVKSSTASIGTIDALSLSLNPDGGNVGIGTTSPQGKLHIVGTGNTGSSSLIFLRDSNATSVNTSYGGIVLSSSPGADYFIAKKNVNADAFLVLGTTSGNLDIMTLTSTGNVEISGLANFAGTPSNAQTGDYTLVLADKGKVLRINSSSNRTVTIPLNSSVAFPIDTEIAILRYGSGTVSISPTSGVTLNSKNSERKISGQYGSIALKKIGTDEWVLVGSLEA
jgi:hypothetical protein